jgi:hypothetical protein
MLIGQGGGIGLEERHKRFAERNVEPLVSEPDRLGIDATSWSR